ncbi:post-transcriptional regulator [Sporosarcina sp. FSL K6-1522]|uniref:post-transcriptional regulator n=1 Tax=Sporosarcina sp. FSL K6-1522 TaxID=2921554 RepID=UPI00315B23E0
MAVQFEHLFTKVRPAIESKRNEFQLYGYSTVTEEDIWAYCVKKKWRKKDIASMRVHEIVNGILQVLPAEYMTYSQIEEQRASDWFSDLNSAELQMLLAPPKSRSDLS